MRTRPAGMATLAAVALVSACTSTTAPPAATSTSPAVTGPSTVAPPAPTARRVNWFDLDVGACLADPPPVNDPNAITVAIVDCTTPHRAEVYLRAPLAVNTAVADVADRKCDEGFTAYTGEPVGSGTFSVTYLIDSNQDRTSANPDPSTVICLLQAAGGGTLTMPARR